MKYGLLVLWCLVNASSADRNPVSCWHSRYECVRANSGDYYGAPLECQEFSRQESSPISNYNVSTSQAQSCIAGGLNPDCTPKQ